MLKVAVYMRISTKNDRQTIETQRHSLSAYIAQRGLNVVEEYVDEGISGAKDSRPALNRMMTDARQHKFDGVLVQRFDRFGRSVRHLVTTLEEFHKLGIEFVSMSEAVDTSTPAGKLVFSVIAAVAEFERNIIAERVKMGMARAKSQGKAVGRPQRIFDRAAARAELARGDSLRTVATRHGVAKDTVAALR